MAFAYTGSRFSAFCFRTPSFLAGLMRIAAASVFWTPGQAKLDAQVIGFEATFSRLERGSS